MKRMVLAVALAVAGMAPFTASGPWKRILCLTT